MSHLFLILSNQFYFFLNGISYYGIKVAIVYHDMYVDMCNEFSVEKKCKYSLTLFHIA